MQTFTERPATITADKVYRKDLGNVLRQFKFLNHTRYTILLRYDWSEYQLKLDPDYTLEPFTNQIIVPEYPQDKLTWIADPDFPQAQPLQTGLETFGFVATDQLSTVAAVSSSATNVLTSPPTTLEGTITADVTKIVSEDLAASTAFVSGQYSTDTARRVALFNDGILRVGQGSTNAQAWEVAGSGILRFLVNPRSAADPGTSEGLSRKGYVDAQVSGVQTNLNTHSGNLAIHTTTYAVDEKPNAAGMSSYQEGLSVMAVSTAGGYPATGIVVTSVNPAKNRGSQVLHELDTERVLTRNGNAATGGWSAWRTVLNKRPGGQWSGITGGAGISSGIETPQATKDEDNLVRCRGGLKNTSGTTLSAGSVIGTLPAGHVPGQPHTFKCNRRTANDEDITVWTATNGDLINRQAWSAGATLMLDAISFYYLE